MKIAVMKLGARIHENDKIGSASNEALATIKMLQLGGADVTAFTKVLDSDKKYDWIKDYPVFFDTMNDFDRLVIVNGNLNFFGGKCSDDGPEIYRAINLFQKPKIYMFYDPYLGMKQCYKSVLSKDWGQKYTQEQLEIKPNILHYITQCKQTNLINEIGQKSCTYYPIEKFPMIMEKQLYKTDFDKTEFDLNYAGTFRGGRREESMIEFFFGLPEEIKVQMFGNIKLEQFTKQGNLRAPEFGKAVTHEKVRETIQKAKATVIIGDPKYIELDDIAERFYESIIYGQITFVDEKYDRTNRAYNNPNLKQFLRVKNRADLVYKLKAIKNDKQLFDDIIKLQVEDLYNNFDKNVFCSDLVKLIGSLE